MTALDNLPDTLRAWGLDVVAVTGWQDRRRPGPFNPIGVLCHHTAAPGPKDAPSLQVCIDGRRDLPGPLCQLLVARSGKVYVISANRCNHAGAGGPLGGGVIGVDAGNTQLVGLEAENDGIGETWPAVQLDAMVRCSAAVLDLIDGRRSHCWAHREYTPRKPDPRGIDMTQFRAAVAIARPPGATTVPTPTSPASDAMVEQWQRQLLANGAQLGGGADGLFGRLTLEASTTVLNHRNQLLAQVGTQAERIDRMLSELSTTKAKVATLEGLVGKAIPAALDVITDLRVKLNEAEAKLQGLA